MYRTAWKCFWQKRRRNSLYINENISNNSPKTTEKFFGYHSCSLHFKLFYLCENSPAFTILFSGRFIYFFVTKNKLGYERKAHSSGSGGNLRHRWNSFHFCLKTPDSILELTVLGGVNERIDAAVGASRNITEVVEPEDKSLIVEEFLM